jgi:hypothetical protein
MTQAAALSRVESGGMCGKPRASRTSDNVPLCSIAVGRNPPRLQPALPACSGAAALSIDHPHVLCTASLLTCQFLPSTVAACAQPRTPVAANFICVAQHRESSGWRFGFTTGGQCRPCAKKGQDKTEGWMDGCCN